MKEKIRKQLLTQGFCSCDIDNQPEISRLARWTPLSCATFGTGGLALGLLPFGLAICPCAIASVAGLWIGSGWFFIVLGLLTLTGGLTSRSIYDRLYNVIFRHLFHTAAVPEHGAPRKFGCGIGGIMYIASGLGFLSSNIWLAFIPAVFMVTFAIIAGLTHWCFASALYGWLFPKYDNTKANNPSESTW